MFLLQIFGKVFEKFWIEFSVKIQKFSRGDVKTVLKMSQINQHELRIGTKQLNRKQDMNNEQACQNDYNKEIIRIETKRKLLKLWWIIHELNDNLIEFQCNISNEKDPRWQKNCIYISKHFTFSALQLSLFTRLFGQKKAVESLDDEHRKANQSRFRHELTLVFIISKSRRS